MVVCNGQKISQLKPSNPFQRMKYIGFASFFAFLLGQYEAAIDESLSQHFITLDLLQDKGIAIDTRRLNRRLKTESNNSTTSEILPLFQGMGTHYSYIYVGTPPQRVSVIVDTGSHHTAFPCVGCNCGKHMNPSFDPSKSNTSKVLKCSGRRCFFQQSYSEGSSWHAFKVADKLWMGGKVAEDISSASQYSIDFNFGCQDSETGLFRTQHVDGIMGMSAAEDTIPHQLVAQKITQTKVFAMCFSIGGGILTLGGVDQSIHKAGSEIQYAKLLKGKGWFTVRLLDISMRPSKRSKYLANIAGKEGGRTNYNSSSISIRADVSILNGRKGVIVDSGTTDTYLPIAVKGLFESLFKKVSDGQVYSNNNIVLSQAQVDRLPTIIYTVEGVEDSSVVHIENEPISYMENLGDGTYAFRIYLIEAAGAILGANVMNSHNVIFDIENKRIGFVPSICKYDDSKLNSEKSRLHVTSPESGRESSGSGGSSLDLIQQRIASFTSGLLGY